MNKAKLKSYAPQARKDFIAAVTARANLLGLSDKAGTLEVAPAQTQGDVTVIAGQPWPAKVDGQRKQLITRINRDGFAQTMEAVAYTWFNRFAALRYMELHDYLGHGHRALSSAEGTLPDILNHAADLAQSGDLPGLKLALVTELKLAGNRDGELYRLLLVAQCNALSNAMPFLFERIDDETELLLPDNLLRTDSVTAKLVSSIDEEDWKEVEIIGWLYQFYISEKKDQVIGKVVKSEDIPAATQLFTPNWIVQYLVQNSVGRLWLMANPQSTLAKEWPYYITPAEQTPEVQAQLDALIQTRVREDGDTLNPESITVLDPACGSGHILVVAYDVLKAIYLERGYQPRAIPRLILEKNLFGLDIDDRAAQMAGFALLMKARADDRRLFNEPIKLNVLALQESKGLDADVLTRALQTVLLPLLPGDGRGEGSPRVNDFSDNDLFPGTRPQISLGEDLHPLALGEGGGEGGLRATITALVDTFEHAKTFGSLIQIPYALKTHLAVLPEVLDKVRQSGDMYATATADDLLPLVQQAQMLAMQFDAVVANPPYMGGGFKTLTSYMKLEYRDESSDLFSCFIERGLAFARDTGISAMITLQSWMFSSSYENLRTKMIVRRTISSLIHVGFNTFPTLNSKIALGCMFSIFAKKISGYAGTYVDLNSAPKSADKEDVFLKRTSSNQFEWDQEVFEKIPGSPISYSISAAGLDAFLNENLGDVGNTRRGLQTGNKDKYIRYWYECNLDSIELRGIGREEAKTSQKKWFLFNNGGDFRRWYGNVDLVVCWGNDGNSIKAFEGSIIPSEHLYFESAICWSRLTYNFGFRLHPRGVIPGDLSPCFYPKTDWELILAYMNSSSAEHFINLINPSLTKSVGDVGRIPIPNMSSADWKVVHQNSQCLIEIYKKDWESRECSYEFNGIRLKTEGLRETRIEGRYIKFLEECHGACCLARDFEESNNNFISSELGLSSQVNNDVPIDRVSLFVNPAYRYGGELGDIDQLTAFKVDFCVDIISYAIGCMMGRYSLDEPGLIYAHAGNVGFEPGRYATFPADADGIVPITDELWFTDDAPSRIREFLRAVWGPDTLEENLAWLAESLGAKSAETPDESIRRYIADKFFKDHLQTYKKRPIYWLFSSGKQGAFQALVYLHRYHEGTLARLRAEYVVPLTGKIQSRIEMLQKDALAASSTAARNKLAKEVEKLKKKHVELLAYDEQLRHHADMRISLDLDDGVKVNYGKFGDLLAEVKAVTGGAGDD